MNDPYQVPPGYYLLPPAVVRDLYAYVRIQRDRDRVSGKQLPPNLATLFRAWDTNESNWRQQVRRTYAPALDEPAEADEPERIGNVQAAALLGITPRALLAYATENGWSSVRHGKAHTWLLANVLEHPKSRSVAIGTHRSSDTRRPATKAC